jgi:putative ABC transport system ATP-binding protein
MSNHRGSAIIMASPIVKVRSLSKTYNEGGDDRLILDAVNLDIIEGEFFVILGKSGSGKSTFLNLLSGIDHPDSTPKPQIIVGGTEITTLDETTRTLYRRDNIGIVFQFFNLIPTLTVLENVTMPLELRGQKRRTAEEAGRRLLARVGLEHRSDGFPDKLSGGEQQRVALARALVHEPLVVLADEPTGNLDEENGQLVLELLLELTRDAGKTLIMATHNPEIVPRADRVCRIHDGELVITHQTNARLPVAPSV